MLVAVIDMLWYLYRIEYISRIELNTVLTVYEIRWYLQQFSTQPLISIFVVCSMDKWISCTVAVSVWYYRLVRYQYV